MSHINVHLITQRAALRIGRVEQVRALAPWPTRHEGDHWQLNRASGKSQRIPGNGTTEPWPEMANQCLYLAVRGVANTTTTNNRRIPFPYVVRHLNAIWSSASGATFSGDVMSAAAGTIWHNASERLQETETIAANAIGAAKYSTDPRIVVPTPGDTLTLSVTTTAVSTDIYLSVIIQPLTDYLKSLGVT
jgi:hypothetical protein